MNPHDTTRTFESMKRKRLEREPVEDAGGGVSEGFEQAERDLIENAEHGTTIGHPLGDRFPVEEAHPEQIHGEADESRPNGT